MSNDEVTKELNKDFDHLVKDMKCKVCSKKNNLKLCGNCKNVYYCSQECFDKDQKNHKKICKKN
jgi:hypothetical protein